MLSRIPSVKDTYFQHKVLSRIHGTPTYETLHMILTELKANASSVPTTLGGGLHGHLGLLLSDARYTALTTNVLFATPINPGPFTPPAAGTAAQIEASRDVWKEAKLTFEICQATEKALIAQLVETIDPVYLRSLLNRATGQYATSIRAILLHLFSTYGKITPQQVKAKEMEVHNMHYDISQPVDTVFNAIDDLGELADHANSPMSPQQMIDLAYVIFARQPILQQDLRIWNRRPAAIRDWPNMMIYLREAQSDLSTLPTAADMYHPAAAHHQANVTSMADLVAQRLLDSMPTLPSNYPIEPSLQPPPDPVTTVPPVPVDMANAISQRTNELQLRETNLMTQMQQMMTLMMNNSNDGDRSNRNGGRGGRGRGRGGRGNRSSSVRKYCHTHGACAHNGTECNTPGANHQASATFANMMGGSNNNCYWITPST